jgi:hypothetical protein
MQTEPQEWAALFYLCGHFNRPDAQDPFVSALDDIRAVGASAQLSVAVYLDLESGARRFALRAGDTEPGVVEAIGAVNSGIPTPWSSFSSGRSMRARRAATSSSWRASGSWTTIRWSGGHRSTPAAPLPSATTVRPTMRSSCTSCRTCSAALSRRGRRAAW